MFENKIFASNGYVLLSGLLDHLPNAKSMNKRVVELPIENARDKMDYLFQKVEEFENKNQIQRL